MYFISILLVMLLLHYRRPWLRKLQDDRWFQALCQISQQLPSPLALIIRLILPCLCFAWLFHLIESSFGLLSILLSTLALIYALGRGRYLSLYSDYKKSWQLQEPQKIQQNLAIVIAQLDKTAAIPDDIYQTHTLARRLFVYQAFQRLFSVLFWFALLGPAGAVFYRLIKLYPEQELNFIKYAEKILEWPCVRLFAFSLGLLGNFSKVISALKSRFFDSLTDVQILLENFALLALNQDMQWQSSRLMVQNDEASLAEQAIAEIDAIKQIMRHCMALAIVFIAILNVLT